MTKCFEKVVSQTLEFLTIFGLHNLGTFILYFKDIIIMSRKKYEYRVENINCDNMGFYDYIYEIERILNKHGENGWELDKMEYYAGRTLLILRREVV